MAYTHVRAMAYQVPTIGVTQVYNAVTKVNDSNYLEVHPGNIPARFNAYMPTAITAVSNMDARKRLARLYAVMLEAKDQIDKLGDNKYTLKVFVAPEFYFRPIKASSTIVPQGNAYTLKEYREIKTALDTLISSEKKFTDWVIIPGTILWGGSGRIGRNRPNTGTNEVFFNSSLFIKVGRWRGPEHKLIEKAYSSQIDGLPTGVHGGIYAPVPGRLATDEQFTIYQTLEKRRKHVMEHYGTECGVEICLEHGKGLLKTLLSADSNWKTGFLRNRKSISLQVLTAGGMGITAENVTVKRGGYVLRTDGLGSGVQAEMRKVTAYGNKNFGRPQPVDFNYRPAWANFSVAPPAFLPVEHTIPLAADLQVPDPGSLPGYHFNQEVRIFNRQPLP